MRVIGEYDKDHIKVTVFQMNGKISIKFEHNLLEQTYKFRDGSGINTLEDAKNFTTNSFIQTVDAIFIHMGQSRMSNLQLMNEINNEHFPEIL
ncbi:MAG: hypothetical protein IPM42_04020 [Saprospiraceae bacterium]|nr:hypothetical protein [Saprospiraceae bacterium]